MPKERIFYPYMECPDCFKKTKVSIPEGYDFETHHSFWVKCDHCHAHIQIRIFAVIKLKAVK
jgi:hypothetical protein